MINEKELRIGNLVMFRKDKIVEVSNLGNLFETIETVNGLRYGSDDINEYNPIALTAEWLEKFGFEKLTDKNKGWKQTSFSLNNGRFIVNFDDGLLTVNFLIGSEYKYVHQLQNLYFALTNEELNIKL